MACKMATSPVQDQVTADFKLTIKKLQRHVIPYVATKWIELGIELFDENDTHMLDNIDPDHNKDAGKCCREMFQKWLETYPNGTWHQIVEALTSPGVQLRRVAEELQENLIVQTPVYPATSQPPASHTTSSAANQPMTEYSHADASVLLDEGISTYSGPTDVEDVKMTSGLVEASDDTTDLEFSIRQPRDHVIQAAGPGDFELTIIFNESPFKLTVNTSDKINQLKQQIEKKTKIPPNKQIIICRKSGVKKNRLYIQDNKELGDYELDKSNHEIILENVFDIRDEEKRDQICDTVKESFDQSEYMRKVKKLPVIAALIREKITVKDIKKRFTTVVLASGIKHDESDSCKNESKNNDNYIHTCAGHAEAICYHFAHVYLLKQIEHYSNGHGVLSMLINKNGFYLNPEYKFHLFTTHPPCGFIENNDDKCLLSWQIPFTVTPHVADCSSKILINAYLGIQGPLTHLFATPVYIDDVIILTDEQPTSSEFTLSIPESDMFGFNPPRIIPHRRDPKELFTQQYKGTKNDKILTCYAVIPIRNDDENELTIKYKFEKKDSKLNPSPQNKASGEIPSCWSTVSTDKEDCILQYKCLKKAMYTLANALDVNKALAESKERIKHILNISETNFEKYLDEMKQSLDKLTENRSSSQLLTDAEKNFTTLKNEYQHRQKYLFMIERLDAIMKQVSSNNNDIDQLMKLLDCCWNRYIKKIEALFSAEKVATEQPER